ncbi:MAG: RDD family protein [Actinomycetota bacterium]|nr:RDD family protein [Actinomycetota bacterium]
MPSRPPQDSPPSPPSGMPGVVSGLGRRLGALCLDWLASLVITVLLFRQVAYGSTASSLATLLVFAAEVIVLTWLIGASFGQRILGLTVVRVDGSRLPLWRVALRTLLICLVIPAVVYDSDGRGLHDRAVGSVVLRV